MPKDDGRGPEGEGEEDRAVKGKSARGDGVERVKSEVPLGGLPEADEFGLPLRPPRRRRWSEEGEGGEEESAELKDTEGLGDAKGEGERRVNCSIAKPLTNGTSVPTQPPEEPSTIQRDPPAYAEVVPGPSRDRDEQLKVGVKEIGTEPVTRTRSKTQSSAGGAVSEWSHQQLAPVPDAVEEKKDDEDEWQTMPAFATHRIYDDWGKVLAKEYDEVDDEHVAYGTLGGAGKGYTRVQIDDDAQSATSMDDDTAYLFNDKYQSNALLEEDEEGRDIVAQMQTTKELLTEGQRIAYVGLVRSSIGTMLSALEALERTKGAKKSIEFAMEATKMWGQKMMVRLYSHMDIDSQEQVMVEQLTEHGVLPSDLTPVLMANARVRNPAKVEGSETSSVASARPSMGSRKPSDISKRASTPNLSAPPTPSASTHNLSAPQTPTTYDSTPLPAYEGHTANELTYQDSSKMQNTKDIDLDLRWTVLCDLFLLLLADGQYDARSRSLLEHVGAALAVEAQEVCRFEKRVTDALEMQEQADKENWNEDEHLDARKKAARNKRLMVMGLCTVGGGLVIGLSAGLLAPVIGAGLAAGFTTIGVAGTSTFLGGAGAAALIGTAGTVTGGVVGVRASNRRTGAVKTFEYVPLFNNKRPNLIVTVSGWMTGNVDDVRLPFSTVDPIMGDIYSINWEPDMLKSTGQTIQILATEALTQTIQQILGSTMLSVLMAGLSLPLILTKLAYLVDNPWTVSLARADAAGLILADSIIDRNLGQRPITLVGFSLGARVIFSALRELAKRGALGLVQNVYLFGSPMVAKKDEYLRARTVVAGRFVNGYATNDWILGYLFRATSGGIMRVAGLSSVNIPGIENKDVTSLVPGHMAYRGMMPRLLQEVGWAVDSLEFSEIEDPDPDNHEKRQRELLDEIEAARRELEVKEKEAASAGEKKSGFKAFFSRKKAGRRKQWEMYDERSQQGKEGGEGGEGDAEAVAAGNAGVMFDVDAIRAEALKLAIEEGSAEGVRGHLSVREIESTLPALRVASTGPNGLKQTRSQEGRGLPVNGSGSAERGASEPHVPVREEISMSFEADERSPAQETRRPPLRSVATTPSPSSWSLPPGRDVSRSNTASNSNPWADDEEFGGGREREVRMEFE